LAHWSIYPTEFCGWHSITSPICHPHMGPSSVALQPTANSKKTGAQEIGFVQSSTVYELLGVFMSDDGV
jgi:hypothetical protein